ncbi:MAG TPA: hypothetical protein VJU81_07170 [Methylomirabilota bacterium]|nr:hypothetical protein [Methylomirabilota bacterium]
MGTGPVPYRDLSALLRALAVRPEDPGTAALIARLRPARRAGEFDRTQFIAMCRWKSPRAVRHYRRHSPAMIRRVSRAVLGTRDEARRMTLLTALAGVSVPTASAVLTLLEPRRYGVLDIRVWQLLHALGAVRSRPDGRGFRLAHWLEFLALLRAQARARSVSVRAVEWTLFGYHQTVQTGRLYERARRVKRAPRALAGAGRGDRRRAKP